MKPWDAKLTMIRTHTYIKFKIRTTYKYMYTSVYWCIHDRTGIGYDKVAATTLAIHTQIHSDNKQCSQNKQNCHNHSHSMIRVHNSNLKETIARKNVFFFKIKIWFRINFANIILNYALSKVGWRLLGIRRWRLWFRCKCIESSSWEARKCMSKISKYVEERDYLPTKWKLIAC